MWGVVPHIFFSPDAMIPDLLLERIRAEVEGLGFELVDLRVGGTAQRPEIKVRADRAQSQPGAGITTEECARLSRALEHRLEEDRLVGPTYVLEVSSPGIERPVRFSAHWRRFIGERVRLRAVGVPGKQDAEIVGLPDDTTVSLRFADGTTRDLPIADVREATLIVEIGRAHV